LVEELDPQSGLVKMKWCALAVALCVGVVEGRHVQPLKPSKVARGGGLNYGKFAKENPVANGIAISTVKTAAADVLAQVSTPGPFDFQRNALFAVFGALYLGAFQYWYQVNIFKKIFTATERFTSESLAEKVRDTNGLVSYVAQIIVDLVVLSCVYLPCFYAFKAMLFSDCGNPISCFADAFQTYKANTAVDVPALIKCWLPADIVCFAIPLYLRLPIRHLFSFCWTIYLSIARGSK